MRIEFCELSQALVDGDELNWNWIELCTVSQCQVATGIVLRYVSRLVAYVLLRFGLKFGSHIHPVIIWVTRCDQPHGTTYPYFSHYWSICLGGSLKDLGQVSWFVQLKHKWHINTPYSGRKLILSFCVAAMVFSFEFKKPCEASTSRRSRRTCQQHGVSSNFLGTRCEVLDATSTCSQIVWSFWLIADISWHFQVHEAFRGPCRRQGGKVREPMGRRATAFYQFFLK